MISQQLYTGKVSTTRYNGLSVTVSDGTKSKTVTKNAVGNIVKMVDPGGTINYAYFANGSMKEANYGTHIVKTEIDDWGRKKKLIDPAAGTYNYTYNILGEILTETTPKGKTTYQYDGNGKPTNKTIIGDLTNLSLGYQYRSDKLLGAINGRDNIASKNYTYTYGYDPTSKLPTSIKEVTPSANFEKILAYDGLNRIKTEKYINTHTLNNINSTIHIENVYNNAGILTEIKDKTTNASLWEVTEENAKGQAKNINLGNGITKARLWFSKKY
jgi:YD repeat-containing protein